MNLFQLVLKQMRQRALSTWLTLLSVILAVALTVAVLILYTAGNTLFIQTDYGYDLLIGAKGSRLNLVMNTVYHIGDPSTSGTIPYMFYEDLPKQFPAEAYVGGAVDWKVPVVFGDNVQGFRIVGAAPALFGFDDKDQALPPAKTFKYRKDKPFEFAQGKSYHARRFEAVLGSEAAGKTGLKVGSTFKAQHGAEETANGEEHHEVWTVTGILKPTHTANDRIVYISLISALAIPEHEAAIKQLEQVTRDPWAAVAPMSAATTKPATKPATKAAPRDEHEEAYELDPKTGEIELMYPKTEWRVAAIYVHTKGGNSSNNLEYVINAGRDAMAVRPAMEMRSFFDIFLRPATLVLASIAILVTVVAAVSILVSIYNAVSARMREIAIIRALGATRLKILLLVCVEAGLIGLAGGVLGLLLAHSGMGIASVVMRSSIGESLPWLRLNLFEPLYLSGVVVLTVLAGLVPALKAYQTPVATNLAGG